MVSSVEQRRADKGDGYVCVGSDGGEAAVRVRTRGWVSVSVSG
jgi:hypothetical protein